MPPAQTFLARRFDAVSISLHWTTVALLVAMFASAWSRGLAADKDQETLILTLHRSLGVTTLAVVALRLAWRLNFAFLPPFPSAMPKLQQQAAKASEYGLYALMLLQPLTGLTQSLERGRPFQLLLWQVPALVPKDRDLTKLFEQVHAVTAWVILAVIGLHVAAALFHRLVLKDEVLQSMLPWRTRLRLAAAAGE